MSDCKSARNFELMKPALLPLIFVVLLSITACRSVNEMAYFVDAQRDSAQAIITTYTTTIHPGDLLNIYVNSLTPESVIPFNQETHTLAAQASKTNVVDTTHRSVITERVLSENISTGKQKSTYGYLVDEYGYLLMPIIGKMKVVGITHDSLQNRIQNFLRDGGYINDAVVTVSNTNFRVSVVGEVKVPRELHVQGNRLTILEAIAMCGDLTMDAVRDNVVVMRMQGGQSTPIVLDLTSQYLFDSPAYYLQTNDIVYIEPNKKKKKIATRDESWPKYVEFWVAVGAAVVNIGRANVALWRH